MPGSFSGTVHQVEYCLAEPIIITSCAVALRRALIRANQYCPVPTDLQDVKNNLKKNKIIFGGLK